MDFNLKIGDLVWAKMGSFSYWPARIVQPGPDTPTKPGTRECQWVYFFGSRNYAWIVNNKIKPYVEFKEQFSKVNKASQFKKAINEIEDFIRNQAEDPNYSLQHDVSIEVEEDAEKSSEKSSEKNSNKPSPKKPKKAAPVKRQNSDASSIRNSSSRSTKKARTSSGFEENGFADSIAPSVGKASGFDISLEILNRPSIIDEPEVSSVNLNSNLELLNTKNITASRKKFGFIGLGTIGSGIVKNLINSGHKVNLYNRTSEKCEDLKKQAENDINKAGLVNTYITPCDVMQNSDITFNCVSDSNNAKAIVIGNCGITKAGDLCDADGYSKGYVEMTSIDPQTSKDMCEIIKSKGGRYLEVQVQGSKSEAEEGSLVVLAAGDESLFFDCQSCFKAMGKMAFFLGEVGYATKTNIILQLMKGIALAGLAEGFALADRCGISSKDVLSIFNLTNLACGYLSHKADLIVKQDFKHAEESTKHMQKKLQLALDLSDQLKQPLLMTSTANEVYKHIRRMGYDDHDASSVYMRVRH